MKLYRCGICLHGDKIGENKTEEEKPLNPAQRAEQSVYSWNELQKHEHGTEDYWEIQ